MNAINWGKVDPKKLQIHARFLFEKFAQTVDNDITVSSGFRTKEEDLAVGASGNTAHTRGLAIDIPCKYSRNRLEIVKKALQFGFHRIGIANDHIHIDIDTSLDPMVIWLE